MKSKIFIYAMFVVVLLFSCNKTKDVNRHEGYTLSTEPASLTGHWKAGVVTDVVTSEDPSIAAVSSTMAMPYDIWEFKEDGKLIMHNDNASMIMSYTVISGNRVVLTFNKTNETLNIIKEGADKIILKSMRKLGNGKMLTETIQLVQN